jgi:hypothetical protein
VWAAVPAAGWLVSVIIMAELSILHVLDWLVAIAASLAFAPLRTTVSIVFALRTGSEPRDRLQTILRIIPWVVMIGVMASLVALRNWGQSLPCSPGSAAVTLASKGVGRCLSGAQRLWPRHSTKAIQHRFREPLIEVPQRCLRGPLRPIRTGDR